ncbi:uncharacterized protein LOC118460893 [Anopheles albimanus]|uniref:Phospholipase A2 n=1 Tax=Anopheles albimanus TaxID=7167 RepID=A0A182FMF6_ANOAL|nr:uncharacterized protein LOC118460893 [Anopheles albimanus]XP_035781539.1 uncharacterized protein LOC118460893 [Anopheles albimanus]XP_035781548.1 uncharacterized protein LOC118460893 [Anopheles albimanus]
MSLLATVRGGRFSTLICRMKQFMLVLAFGLLSGTILETARAKPTLTFKLSQVPGFTHIVERRLVDAMKTYSERRLEAESLRMIYFHDQTVAVVELGPAKRLLGCELIEIYSDIDGTELLRNLSIINRPLEISFGEMIQLMEQCEQVDRLNERNHYRATLPPGGWSDPGPIAFRSPVASDVQQDAPVTSSSTASTEGGGFLGFILRNHDSKQGIFKTGSFSLLSGIIPGTKWCGTGDIAESYHDLGDDAVMDRCCRTHDLCPMKVRAYQKRYNLNNDSIYTKSHCKCDDMLFDCLKQTNTSASQVMGSIYFNLVQVPCVEDTINGFQFRKARDDF